MPTDYMTARQRDYGRVRANLARLGAEVSRFPATEPTRIQAGELHQLGVIFARDHRGEMKKGDDLGNSLQKLRQRLDGWPAPDEVEAAT